MQHCLSSGLLGAPAQAHTPAQAHPHSRSGQCSHALREPRGARRLRRDGYQLAAATLDAPGTEEQVQDLQEAQDEPSAAQAAPSSNGVASGEMSMEHPDKRALYERFFQLLSKDLSPRYEVGDRVKGRVLRSVHLPCARLCRKSRSRHLSGHTPAVWTPQAHMWSSIRRHRPTARQER